MFKTRNELPSSCSLQRKRVAKKVPEALPLDLMQRATRAHEPWNGAVLTSFGARVGRVPIVVHLSADQPQQQQRERLETRVKAAGLQQVGRRVPAI